MELSGCSLCGPVGIGIAVVSAVLFVLVSILKARQPQVLRSIRFSVVSGAPWKSGEGAHVVTGGSGTLGARIIDEIFRADKSANVVSFDLFPPAADRKRDGVTYVVGDMRSPAHLNQLMETAASAGPILCVFHTAALLPSAATTYANLHEVNAGGTAAIIDAAHRAKARCVVYTSSASVVMADKLVDIDGCEGETMALPEPRDLVDDYARSKLAGERVAANSAVPIAIIRPSIIVDRCDRKMVEGLLKGQNNVVFDQGAHCVDFVWSVDVARAHVSAFKALSGPSPPASGRVYHIGAGERVNVIDWVGCKDPAAPGKTVWGNGPPTKVPFSIILAMARLNHFVVSVTGWAPVDFYLRPDSVRFLAGRTWWFSNDRARKELGFKPTPLPDMVKAMRAEMKAA